MHLTKVKPIVASPYRLIFQLNENKNETIDNQHLLFCNSTYLRSLIIEQNSKISTTNMKTIFHTLGFRSIIESYDKLRFIALIDSSFENIVILYAISIFINKMTDKF